MTERRAGALHRGGNYLAIGPSSLIWDGAALTFRIRERSAPVPSAVRGTVRVFPEAFTGWSVALDPAGHHVWTPMAPRAAVEVAFDAPSLAWRGTGYLDSNTGDAPLERDFTEWDWSRAALPSGETAILFEAVCREAPANDQIAR